MLAKFYLFGGVLLFLMLVGSLFPVAKYISSELHFYFFYIFLPLLLLSFVLIFLGIMHGKNK